MQKLNNRIKEATNPILCHLMVVLCWGSKLGHLPLCPLFNRQSDVSFHPQGSKHMMVVRLQTITNKLAFIQYRNQSRIIF
jgi:hypothetical protein